MRIGRRAGLRAAMQMGNSGSSGGGGGFGAWWATLPQGTRLILLANTGLFVLGWCLPPSWTASSAQAWGHFCLFPRVIWTDPSQAYRIVTSAFTHQNIMHIGFNMLTFVASGPGIERNLGTIRFLNLIVALVLVLGVFFLCIADVALFVFRHGSFFNQCAAGFSGVLFALLTIEAYSLPPETQMSVFGNRVPARWYPWAQLLLCQLLIPNASMIGHLVGIIGGFCQHFGYLSWIIIPPSIAILVEESRLASAIPSFAASSFVPCAGPDLPPVHLPPWGSSVARVWMARLWPWRWRRMSLGREADVEAGVGNPEGRQAPSFTGFGTWGGGGVAYAPVPGAPPSSAFHQSLPSQAQPQTVASPAMPSAQHVWGIGAHHSRLLDEMPAAQAGKPPRHPHRVLEDQVNGGHVAVAGGGRRSVLSTHVVGSPWREVVGERTAMPTHQSSQADHVPRDATVQADAPAPAPAPASAAAPMALVRPGALEWGGDRVPDVGFGAVLGAPPRPSTSGGPNHQSHLFDPGHLREAEPSSIIMDAALAEGLDMLVEMGCGSRAECHAALQEAGGDVSAAAGNLVEMRESSLGPLRLL